MRAAAPLAIDSSLEAEGGGDDTPTLQQQQQQQQLHHQVEQEQHKEQQQQQQQGFDDVEVYMVCPATISWAASQCSKGSSSSSSSSSRSRGRAAAAAEESVLRACQWLVKTETVRSLRWRSPLVLQGELLQFGVVLLPQQHTAAAAGEPAAVRAWLEKYASLHGSVDLLLRDTDSSSSSSSSSSKAAGQSALSCQFWEAQAFPIDSQETVSVKISHCTYTAADAAAAPAARGGRKVHKEETAEASLRCCIICDVRIPMTVNPQCLGIPLSLECCFRLSRQQQLVSSALDSIRGNINVPVSAWAAAAGVSAATTRALQPGPSPLAPLAALSLTLDATATAAAAAANEGGSSSSNSSVCSTTTGASSAAAGAAAARAQQQQQQQQQQFPLAAADSSSSSRMGTPRGVVSSSLSLRDERVSLGMQLMMQALGSSAGMPEQPAAGSQSGLKETEEETQRSFKVCCSLVVQRPLQVTTALMDSFMYVQIENSTDSIPVVVESVILRSVNSNAQGELPVTLQPQEQHSVLLRLDEAFLYYGAPQWGASGTDGGKGLAGDSKAVLPLCLKWHVAGSSGPAVWSQFGAECQLPLRPPLQVSLTCLSDGGEGGLLTAVLCVVNHGASEVDLLALLPRDLQYHLQPALPAAAAGSSSRHSSSRPAAATLRGGAAYETPALIPLSSKKDLGRIAPGCTQSVYLQFLATRSGLHALPPLLLLDRGSNRKVLARGGQVLVTH